MGRWILYIPGKNPFDIDIVTFIDFDIVKAKEKELKDFIFPKSLENFQMDAYIIAVYPENTKSYIVTQADRSYWMEHFGKTKPNRYRKRVSKGFLKIII
jgi:hypothetical protein